MSAEEAWNEYNDGYEQASTRANGIPIRLGEIPEAAFKAGYQRALEQRLTPTPTPHATPAHDLTATSARGCKAPPRSSVLGLLPPTRQNGVADVPRWLVPSRIRTRIRRSKSADLVGAPMTAADPERSNR